MSTDPRQTKLVTPQAGLVVPGSLVGTANGSIVLDLSDLDKKIEHARDPNEIVRFLTQSFPFVTEEHFQFLNKLGGARKLREFYYEILKFDTELGIRTSDFISEQELKQRAIDKPEDFAGADNAEHTVKHRASLTHSVKGAFEIAIQVMRDRGLDASVASVFDMGTGTGKPALIAAYPGFGFPFKKVIGIDFYKGVLDTARTNADKLQIPQTKLQFVFADAGKFRDYNGLNVVYMYNPFDREIVDQVRYNLQEYAGKTIVCYNKPLHGDVFEKAGWILENEIGNPKPDELWKQDKHIKVYSHGFDPT